MELEEVAEGQLSTRELSMLEEPWRDESMAFGSEEERGKAGSLLLAAWGEEERGEVGRLTKEEHSRWGTLYCEEEFPYWKS